MRGEPGKCPCRNSSLTVTFLAATSRRPGLVLNDGVQQEGRVAVRQPVEEQWDVDGHRRLESARPAATGAGRAGTGKSATARLVTDGTREEVPCASGPMFRAGRIDRHLSRAPVGATLLDGRLRRRRLGRRRRRGSRRRDVAVPRSRRGRARRGGRGRRRGCGGRGRRRVRVEPLDDFGGQVERRVGPDDAGVGLAEENREPALLHHLLDDRAAASLESRSAGRPAAAALPPARPA